jgi:hypothetical protein
MNTPKILPWLAHKAGITEKRAEELWAQSLRYATIKTGWVGTSEYWQVAMEHLEELVQREATCQRSLTPPLRYMVRIWMVPMMAWQGLVTVLSTGWSKLVRTRGHAH